jgi:DNA-binding response OmpR family regulator
MEQFSALVICNDPSMVGMAHKALEEQGMAVKVAQTATAADLLLQKNRFDLALFDNDVPGAMQLAGAEEQGNFPKMVFAMVQRAKAVEMYGRRVHFIVQKPFTADLLSRSLRAAFGVMLRERRAAFRHIVDLTATSCVAIKDKETKNLGMAVIVDISETGLCLQTREVLQQGTEVQVTIPLPDGKEPIEAQGTVVWNQSTGKSGIKFTRMAMVEKQKLSAWLDSMMPYDMELQPRHMAHAR